MHPHKALRFLALVIGFAFPSSALANESVNLTPRPAYPKPSTSFNIWVRETLTSYGTRINRSIVMTLAPSLYNALSGIEVDSAYAAQLSVSYSMMPNYQVSISIADNGTGMMNLAPGGEELFKLEFNGISAQSCDIQVNSVAYTDLSNNGLIWDLDTTPLTMTVADLVILPTALDTAMADHAYLQGVSAPHASNAVAFSISSGTIPSGLTFSPDGRFSGMLASSSVGTYSFMIHVQEQGGNSLDQSFQMVVSDPKPVVSEAFFVDVDGSKTVNAGDIIELHFNEPVTFGNAWHSALAPSRVGDTFGTNAILSATADPKILKVTLGTSPVLASLGMNTGVHTSSVANGIVDAAGNAVLSGTYILLEPLPDFYPLENLVLGSPIQPITINRPPFYPAGYEALRFPAGIGLVTTAQNGTKIVGTPTALGFTDGLIRRTADASFQSRIGFMVRNSPLPSFGVRDFNYSQDPIHVGEFLALDLISQDETTPVAASIGGTALVAMPGSNPTGPMFAIPDSTPTGNLVVTQGVQSATVGSVTIQSFSESGVSPFVHTNLVWFPDDTITYPFGAIFVHGYNFGSSTTVTVAGAAATVTLTSNHYVVAALPSQAQADSMVTVVVDNHQAGSVPASFSITGITLMVGTNTFNSVEGKDRSGEIKKRMEAWCKDLQDAVNQVGTKTPKGNDWRFLILFKLIALHESIGLTTDIQSDHASHEGTAGYGLTQMGPASFADAMKKGGADGAQAKKSKQLAGTPDKSTPPKMINQIISPEDYKCLMDEACEMQTSGKFVWKPDSKACKLLRTNDKLAAALSRLYIRSLGPGDIGGVYDPGAPGKGGDDYWKHLTDDEKSAAFDLWLALWHKPVDGHGDPLSQDAIAALKKLFLDNLCTYLKQLQ